MLDVPTEDPEWSAWSGQALAECAERSAVAINPLVYAEVSIRFERIEELEHALPDQDFPRLPCRRTRPSSPGSASSDTGGEAAGGDPRFPISTSVLMLRSLASSSHARCDALSHVLPAARDHRSVEQRADDEKNARQLVEAEKQRADAETKIAQAQRRRADEKTLEAYGRAYIADMRLVQQSYDTHLIERVWELLEGQRPERTEGVDLRGFEWHYWWRRSHLKLLILKGHTDAVESVCISVDGKRIVSRAMLDLATAGIKQLAVAQRQAAGV